MRDHLSSRPQQEPMTVQGHHRLARTLYFIAMIPPVSLAFLCSWILPQLPPINESQLLSLETPFLGFTLLSAVLCDTMYYLRLKRFRALPSVEQLSVVPPALEVKRGWRACLVAWGFVQVYVLLGVMEAFFSREESAMFPFVIFGAITMYRCRPRAGLFAETMWGGLTRVPQSEAEDDSFDHQNKPSES